MPTRIMPHPVKRALRATGIFGLYLAVIAIQQHEGGAVQGEYGGNPDEAGYFITGLMVRDYVAQGAPGSPMEFARTYYAHYPKVALGHWPPLFFVVQAAWTLLLPPSRWALMLLTAVLAALTALAIYLGLRRDFGRILSFAGGGLFLLIPVVQELSMILMADILTALLAFLAACWWGRFLDSERARDAAGFGFFAALAILTKGSGFALALLPPLAVLFGREFGLLKKPAFWFPPLLIVGVLCVPWYALTYPLMANGFEHPQGLRSSLEAFLYYPARFLEDFGIPLTLLAGVGLVAKVFRKDEGLIQSQWIVRGALLSGFFLFHCIVTSAYDIRYLLPAFAAAVMLAVAGADEIGRLLAVRFGGGRAARSGAAAERGPRTAERGREALGAVVLGVA
ncbi:MAG: glycosyltransferase family 39 protein, partial [Lentisphaerae bacterium]|nr:glycosyltransferase family 39 protein [Lentisphaerota bacterium]